jgi:hypothetical protein
MANGAPTGVGVRAENAQSRFTVVITVGPETLDLARASALLWRLPASELKSDRCTVVEELPHPSGLTQLAWIPRTCYTVRLRSPRKGRPDRREGGLTLIILTGRSWLHTNTDAEYALRIAAEVVANASIAAIARLFITQAPQSGRIRAASMSANRAVRRLEVLSHREPDLRRLSRLRPSSPHVTVDPIDGQVRIPNLCTVSPEALRSCDAIRPHVDPGTHRDYAL